MTPSIMLATSEDFNLPEGDGSSVLTVTVALDPRQTQSPRVTGADRGGPLALLPL